MIEQDPHNAKPTLFTKLFKAQDEDRLDFDEIRDTAQVYIVAGSDTTAHTLTYLVWAVCRNVGIRDRLVREVQVLPSDFSDRELSQLSYHGHVIDEALRLYCAAPSGLPRTVPPEGARLAGYWIPGGIAVCSQAYSLHRDPEIFPQPDVFNPSRWGDATRPMREAFMPFGGGARG